MPRISVVAIVRPSSNVRLGLVFPTLAHRAEIDQIGAIQTAQNLLVRYRFRAIKIKLNMDVHLDASHLVEAAKLRTTVFWFYVYSATVSFYFCCSTKK